MSAESEGSPSRARLIAAFAAVYVLWGSTYVAIKFAVETLPPFTMAGVRFVAAGLILFAWTSRSGDRAATWRQWRSAAIAGALMMMASNGLVCWAEKRVDSSLAALLVATVPLWMMTIDWARPAGKRPAPRTIAGVCIGLLGVAILVWPESNGVHLDFAGVLALLVATLCWSLGSIYTRTADLHPSMIRATAMQMTLGGVFQFALGASLGELGGFEPSLVTAKSLWSLAYLLVAGSLVGFTAYIWLLRNTTATAAATYAYVNPIVAVILGAWLASEEITLRRLVGAAVVVLGVVLSLTSSKGSRARLAKPPLPPDPRPAPAADSRRG